MDKAVSAFPANMDVHAERAREAMQLQCLFLRETFIPACSKLGIEAELAMRLMPRFFNGVGGIYRQSDVQSDVFLRTLKTVGVDLLDHADACKYHASRRNRRDIGWEGVVPLIEGVRHPEVQIDQDQRVAFHDVFFPIVEGDGAESRIRSVFHFDERKSLPQEFHHRILNCTGISMSIA